MVLLALPFDLIDLELDALVGFLLRGDRGDLLDLVLFFFVLFALLLADESSENLAVGCDDDAAARRSEYSAGGEEPGHGALLS